MPTMGLGLDEDPEGAQLRLAVGAALFNLTVALARLGIRPLVTLLPDRAEPDLLAAVRHGGTIPVIAQVLTLADAAGRWATHREQLDVPGVAAEVARWTTTEEGRDDGVAAETGGPLPDPTLQLLDPHDRGGRPLFGVLSSHQQGDVAEVRTGQALQRVLLTATSRGLVVTLHSELVTMPAAREAVAAQPAADAVAPGCRAGGPRHRGPRRPPPRRARAGGGVVRVRGPG